jgi:hypothetical protein
MSYLYKLAKLISVRKSWKFLIGSVIHSSGMLTSVALVRTDVSGENIASIIRVKRIGKLGTMLAATSN